MNIELRILRHLNIYDFKTLVSYGQRISATQKYMIHINKVNYINDKNNESPDDELLFNVNIANFSDFVNNLNDGTIKTFLSKQEMKEEIEEQFKQQLPFKKAKFLDNIKHISLEKDIEIFLINHSEIILKNHSLPIIIDNEYSVDFKKKYRNCRQNHEKKILAILDSI